MRRAPLSSSGRSPDIVRITKKPLPSRAERDTRPRHLPESLSQASTSSRGCSWGKRARMEVTAGPLRGSAGTRQCLRCQSNQRPGICFTASLSSSSIGKENTSSALRVPSSRSQTSARRGSSGV